MLRRIDLSLLTDVSGQPVGPIFKEQAAQGWHTISFFGIRPSSNFLKESKRFGSRLCFRLQTTSILTDGFRTLSCSRSLGYLEILQFRCLFAWRQKESRLPKRLLSLKIRWWTKSRKEHYVSESRNVRNCQSAPRNNPEDRRLIYVDYVLS